MPGWGNTAGNKTRSQLSWISKVFEGNIIMKETFKIIAYRKCFKKREDNVIKNDVRGK